MHQSTCIGRATFLLFTVIAALPVVAQSAPPEPDLTYGEQGTRELGLAGSIQFPMSINNPPEDYPDEMGATSIMLQPFFKLFLANGLHADVKLLYQSSYTNGSEFQDESEQTVVMILPSVGYALALLPRLQIDISLQGGVLTFTSIQGGMEIQDTTPSGGGSLMLLSPISESAVFGAGIILNWTELDFGSDELLILQKIIPIQISWYFS